MPSRRSWLYRFVAAAAALAFAFHHPVTAQDQKPIRIGFSIAQTGPLSAAGKSGLLALQIWRDDVNAHGGLLGRQIELVVYDDQGNASMTPGIYTKLIDVDKVDLLLGPYGTNPTASIMPLIKQRDLLLMGNFALEANSQLRHDKYFNNQPWSSARDSVLPFMELCRKLGVSTIAVLAADAEYGQKIANGIRAELTAFKLQAVYDQNYPPNTVDFSSMLRAIRSKKPDAVFVASYPAESTAIIRALNEQGVGDSVKLFGGGMVGLQYASVMESMGSQLNGVVNYHSWAPEKSLDFPGMRDFLARYQSKAKQANVDPLGYYLPPYNYAMGQILALAVNATKSLDHKKLAQYIHTHDLPTIVGSVHYGPTGEWANSRMIYVQFRGVLDKDLDQFRQSGRQVIVAPDAFKTGEALPFNQAHK